VRGDAGVGKSTLTHVSVKAAARGWRVLLSTAVEAEASVIGRGDVSSAARASDGAERAADKDRGQFAAVVTEHEPKYGGNSPDCRTPP
jgi:predicted ATP-dependent serine protease